MRSIPILLTACLATLVTAGCSQGARQGGGLVAPQVSDTAARFDLAGPIKAKAELSGLQILFLRFTFGDAGKHGALVSSGGDAFPPSTGIAHALGAFLFGPPVTAADAESAAAYHAIAGNPMDGIIVSKSLSDESGFSLFGLIGWGSSSATIEGQGVKLVKR